MKKFFNYGFFFCAVVISLFYSNRLILSQTPEESPQNCSDLTFENWQTITQNPATDNMSTDFVFLPNNRDSQIIIDNEDTRSNKVICAALIKDSDQTAESITIMRAIPNNGETTVTINVKSENGSFWFSQKLVIVSLLVVDQETKNLNLTDLGIYAAKTFNVSPRLLSVVLSIGLLIGLYWLVINRLAALQTSQQAKNSRNLWNPLNLTSGIYGKSSLSQFQLLCFTLLILGKVIYALLRIGTLIGLSADILLLLGISTGGFIGAKGFAVSKKRLEDEHWKWLREQGWLTIKEKGAEREPDEPAKFIDLFSEGQTNNNPNAFSITKFQLFGFSFVIWVYLLKGYEDYIKQAREVALILQTIFGKEGTKFQTDIIKDEDLLPNWLD